jgi:hypothetical protein
MKSKTIIIMLCLTIGLLSACALLPDGKEDDIEALIEQNNLLATQNALLQEQIASGEGNDVNAPSPPEGEANPQMAMSTPTPESLSTEPVPAGMPITYDGWSMTVSKELDFLNDGNEWGLTIFIRNLGETKRTFRFMNASLSARDELGNVYEYVNDSICEKMHFTVKNLEVDGEDGREIHSEGLGYNQCDNNWGIDMYQGPIPIETEQLIISFQDFGPFDGIEVIIDL